MTKKMSSMWKARRPEHMHGEEEQSAYEWWDEGTFTNGKQQGWFDVSLLQQLVNGFPCVSWQKMEQPYQYIYLQTLLFLSFCSLHVSLQHINVLE